MTITYSFIVTLLSVFLTSTTYADAGIKKVATQNSSVISKKLNAWNQSQKSIQLQKHQLFPIDYLEKNKDIKGLMINHYLGTGKTYLAIGFAERNEDRPVVILAPHFLKAHWLAHIKKYGVKNSKRYRIVGYNEIETLSKEDLSETLVILDESHRFIEKVQSQIAANYYKVVYQKIRKAHRILSMTGTPIYNASIDLAYQVNLVSGKDILPFNKEQFRLKHSKVDHARAFWRGHLMESQIFQVLITTAASALGFSAWNNIVNNPILSVLCGSLYLVPMGIQLKQSTHDLIDYPIRDFDPEILAASVKKYISYYSFDESMRDYPSHSQFESKLMYHDGQLSFLNRFYDSKLNDSELSQLLKDQKDSLEGEDIQQAENIALNSSNLQDALKWKKGAGREIGNLSFIPKSTIEGMQSQKMTGQSTTMPNDALNQSTFFPQKFKTMLSVIKQSKGPVAVYSHYYHNGLLLFKQFLDAAGYQGKYRIFHPEMTAEEHSQITEDFNQGKIDILLLHPDITEGISLKGTRQLHFLEMPINSALQKQIIGRAIRYQSHQHLPLHEQHVGIYTWHTIISPADIRQHIAARKHWHHNFSEVSYYSLMGSMQVDPNQWLKRASPDTHAFSYLSSIDKQITHFRHYVNQFCIENTSPREAS